MSHIVTSVTVFLTGLLPASCHKTAPKAATPAPSAMTASAAAGVTNSIHDLGELTLTNHYETCVHLGDGKNCTLMPRVVGHNVELTVSFQTFTPAGQTLGMTVTQVTGKPGKPMEIALGDYQVSFTPKIQ